MNRLTTRTLRDWPGITDGPSLFLPWGWFGRPFDNAHEVTGSILSPRQVVLELDRSLLVVASGIGSIEIDARPQAAETPVASPGWTTLTIGQVTLLTVIWSESDFESGDDLHIRYARNTYFVLIAPRISRGQGPA